MEKKLYKAGFGVYAALFVLAIVLYKERTLFVDIAFHLFEIIRTEDVAIQNYRFGSVFTQIFPLLARKMNFSLQAIMLVYSCCFVFYYYLCYWLCGTVFKHYKLALVLLLSQILFVTDTFYWVQSELPQGLAFMMVTFSFINTLDKDRWQHIKLIFLLAAVVTVSFFHPLLVIPVLFIAIFLLLNKGYGTKRMIVLFSVIILSVILYKIRPIWFGNLNDDTARKISENNFKYLSFFEYFTVPSSITFLKNCLIKYYWIPVFSIGVSLLYFLQRKWLKLILFVSFVLGHIVLVNVSYAFANATDFYIENLYLPIGVMLGMAIVYDVIPYLQSKSTKLVPIAFALIVITGVVRIYSNHNSYTARLDWERSVLENNRGQKLLAKKNDAIYRDQLIMTWGTPYEFLLLSLVEYDEPASICIHENINDVEWAFRKKVKNGFVTQYGVFRYWDLPRDYFNFTDSATYYKLVELKK